MFRMPKFITAQWHDVRGNAKWDFTKWGIVAVISGVVALVRFLGRAPLWQVVVVFILTAFLVLLLYWVIQRPKKEKPKIQNEPFQPDDQSRRLFTAMVDAIKSDSSRPFGGPWRVPNLESIGALVTFSNDIRSESELEWLCSEFEMHEHGHPFELFELHTGDFFKGQRLLILRDARHTPREIKTTTNFVDFLTTGWSKKEQWKEAQERQAGLSGSITQ